MSVVLKPAINTQREAEAALAMVLAIARTRGDERGITKLDHVTIVVNPGPENTTVNVFNGDKVVMLAIISNDESERPFFVTFSFGPWRWIIRRAHNARLAEA